MHTRQNVLSKWIEEIYPNSVIKITPLAGDASFRRYFRLELDNKKLVIMDSPLEKEPLLPFITTCKALRAQGIHTPKVEAVNFNHGFAILEDFGDRLLFQKLTSGSADHLYKKAMDILLQIQSCPPPSSAFNKQHMQYELDLFKEWFLGKHLEFHLTANQLQLLEETFTHLIEEISSQPQVFIHRDYHSRNLMLIQENPLDIGVIDFQDAMVGPFTYDLVSLLKDCYIQWPRNQILQWVTYFYERLQKVSYSQEEFIRAFDFCGLQRHLKVLGIFCRLHYRDQKSAYLNDLPLVFNYVLACLESYEDFQPLHTLMQNEIYPRFLTK